MNDTEPAGRREQLIAELTNILAAASGERGEPGRVLADDAVRLAGELAAVAADGDVQAWYVVAIVHWFRYQLLPTDRDQDDLVAALTAFAKLMPYAADLVPEPVQQFFRDNPGVVAEGMAAGQDLAAVLNDQASYLLRDPRTAGDVTALERAIGWLEQAVALTPSDHPDRAMYLSNLGAALGTRFERVGVIADLDQAITAYQQALHQTAASPIVRARAGRAAAALAADQGDWATAEIALTAVIDLLPTLTDHGLDPIDRQHHLSQLQGLAADAARATLGPHTHTPHRQQCAALAWQRLEQARNVLLTQALETRHSLHDLPPTHQHLAAEYDRLREILTAGTSTGGIDVR